MSTPSALVVAEATLPAGERLQVLRIDAPADSAGFALWLDLDGARAGALDVAVNGHRAELSNPTLGNQHDPALADLLVAAALELLADEPITVVTAPPAAGSVDAAWWRRHGFRPSAATDGGWERRPPVTVQAPDADAMRALGARLAAVLRPGDVIIANGDLGAGKTTLTQGIGAGLGVTGPVISPTFVLSRVHRGGAGRPSLVHVDAYRLGSFDELEDLDLEASLPESVTLIEWGGGIAEGLAEDRLEIDIRRGLEPEDETRLVFLNGIGARWADEKLEELR